MTDSVTTLATRSEQHLLHEQSGGLLTITLNRPEKLNALTYEIYEKIGDLVRAADKDPSCRAVLIKGEGRAFSAGFDLAQQVAEKDSESRIASYHTGSNRTRWAIWNCTKPVIAAVHGYCLAGAFELVLPTDFTIASESCELGLPEILFGSGSAFLMVPWMMNHKQAKQVLLLGDRMSATEAHRIGLVSEVVPDDRFEARVAAVADRLCKVPTGAVRLGKQGINRAYEVAGMVPHINGWVESVVHLSDFSDEVTQEFKRRVEDDGPAAAAKWRSEYFKYLDSRA
ncbi:enoyl-CoA hydratase/isomerase family protein [Arthrobacter sp. S39]|uniref:enoyl-CoA hydratase/isomerase family protein n=1 Tax=Arthrobacter sp. S39 TaxID=2509720 RepID=UPI001A9465EF|nr:enoyl-CoA hydratase/isomerase family protein [Arthrobacter sp. S39]